MIVPAALRAGGTRMRSLVIPALGASEGAARLLGQGPCEVRTVHCSGVGVGVPGCPDLVYVSGPGNGLLPLHVVVGRGELAGLRDACSAGIAESGIPLLFDLSRARRFSARLVPESAGMRSATARQAVASVAAWLCAQPGVAGLGEPLSKILSAQGRWARVLRADLPPLTEAIRSLIGRGAGSTPAGDDMLVGALAYAWSCEGESSGVLACAAALAEEFGQLTTCTSATYLRAALRGDFGSHLVSFVRALPHASDAQLGAYVARVARHGSTSGLDTLAGFVLAAGGSSDSVPFPCH